MQVINDNGNLIKAWIDGVSVEDGAVAQLKKCAQMPFIFKHVAAMPDAHVGMGACIGSVIPTIGAVMPSAVGVDIGCGMAAVRTTLTESDIPEAIRPDVRFAIENAIPAGRSHNGGKGDIGAWDKLPTVVEAIWLDELAEDYDKITEKHRGAKGYNDVNQLGTLGTGNHFIEICLDKDNRVWFMLHSGSRGCGNRIGSYFIKFAKELCNKWFINLPDSDLAYFPQRTEEFSDYMFAVGWAQKFARLNRDLMMQSLVDAIRGVTSVPEFEFEGDVVDCHHNYVAFENHFGKNILVTRKGAIRARKDELAIIPGSMGTRSYIVRGLGNRDSFCSASHGAGRCMSRTRARKTITVDQHVAATKGVECVKDKTVLDESPLAYKDIDKVIEAERDLVEPVHTLRQIICVKGIG